MAITILCTSSGPSASRSIRSWRHITASGVSSETPLAVMWRQLRMLRLADGPDEVHKMVIAMRELNKWRADESAPQNGKPEPAAAGGRA